MNAEVLFTVIVATLLIGFFIVVLSVVKKRRKAKERSDLYCSPDQFGDWECKNSGDGDDGGD